MKNSNKSKKPISISVIGARAYPSDFVGTSGLEVYVEKTIRELLKLNPNLQFLIYTRKEYQPKKAVLPERVKIKTVFTLSSKVLESVVYSFIASIYSIFDSSKIVWYQGVGPGFFFFIPRAFAKKVFLTVHSLDWERKKWNTFERFLFKLGATFVFFLKPNIFTVSKKLKNTLAKRFGIQAIYAPPGIELYKGRLNTSYLKQYGLKKNEYLLFLGRLVPEKRVEWLIETYLKLKKRFKNLKLVLAGGHGNLPQYEKGLKEKYKNPNIVWTGYVFGEEKLSLLYNCCCFVLPSELEGNPVGLTEALGVASRCVLPEEVAREYPKLDNVLVFETKSEESFSKVTGDALVKIKEKYKYSQREQKIIKRRTWRKTAKNYELQFTKLKGN